MSARLRVEDLAAAAAGAFLIAILSGATLAAVAWSLLSLAHAPHGVVLAGEAAGGLAAAVLFGVVLRRAIRIAREGDG